MDSINIISARARVISWKRQFGTFVRCPECFHCLSKCELCKGTGKVIQDDIYAWNNPVAKLMRQELNK